MATRQQLVKATADLLQRKGYAATGVAQMLDASGTTRGSLYFHFPGGKEELSAEALRWRGSAMEEFIRQLMRNAPTMSAAVTAFAGALALRLTDSDYERGCALATATLDAATESETIRDACNAGYTSWHALLAARTREEGWSDEESADLATLVLSSLEGALILARARQDPEPIHTTGRMLSRLFTREDTT